MTERLPIQGQDAGVWGDILNTYLLVSHTSDGAIQPGIITATEISDTAGITAGQLSASVQDALSAASASAPGLSASSVVTTTYTTGINQIVPADATNAAFTVTLPTAPADKSRVIVKKIDSSSHVVTVAAGSGDVLNKSGGSTSVNLQLQNQALSLQYASSGGVWYILGDDVPLSQLDNRYRQLSLSVAHVLQMPNPLQSAVGDGTWHPLSERFTTLAAAQAVFPRATTLTESIDRHALQYALDNYDAVDYGSRNLLIDAPVYTSDPTTARGLGNQKLYGTGWLTHDSIGPAHAILRSGNSRSIANDSAPLSSEAPDCPYLDITVNIDGNKASIIGDTATMYMVSTSYSTFDVTVKNPQGSGFYLVGVTGFYTYGSTIKHLEVYGSTSLYAARVSNVCRGVLYVDVNIHDNDSDGLFIDASEGVIGLIRATNNGSSGVWVHNVFGLVGGTISTNNNGKHGVKMSGITSSLIEAIISSNNGILNDGSNYADLYWDATALNYGVSFATTIGRAVLGPTNQFGAGGVEKWAQYFEDGVNKDIDVTVRYLSAGKNGYHRLPATLGTLRISQLTPGSADVTYPAGGSPALQKLSDVVISTTPTDGQVLKYVGAAGTWQPGTDEGGAGSTTLAGMTDVAIVSPTNGQTLVYNAATGKWQSQARKPAYTIASGSWWQSASGTTSTLTLTQSTMFLIPTDLPAAQVYKGFALQVMTAATSATIRAGIYPQDAHGMPDLANLIGEFGVIDGSTTGMKTLSGLNISGPEGRAWIAIVGQGGAPVVQSTNAGAGMTFPLPASINPPTSSTPFQMLSIAGVTGALPTSGTIVSGPGTTAKFFLQAA